MNVYCVVEDETSEYHNQIAIVLGAAVIGNNLSVYYCLMPNSETVSFLAYQMSKIFILRSQAESYANG